MVYIYPYDFSFCIHNIHTSYVLRLGSYLRVVKVNPIIIYNNILVCVKYVQSCRTQPNLFGFSSLISGKSKGLQDIIVFKTRKIQFEHSLVHYVPITST